MDFNYDFYMASVVIMAILITYHFNMPKVKSLSNRVYGYLLVLTFGCCLFDVIWGEVFLKKFPEDVFNNYLFQILSYSTQNLVPVVYLLYICVLVEEKFKITLKVICYCIPAIAVQVLIWTTPWTGLAFTYSAEKGYQRGPFLNIFVLLAFIYILCGMLEMFVRGRKMGNRYMLSATIFVVATIVLTTLQMMFPGYQLIACAATICCLVMQLTLQNPQLIKEAKEKEVAARIEAEEANKAKSSFLANMSHEIRTPMNAICGMAEILEKSNLNPLEREYVQTIQKASKSLLSIIDDVLDFSKIDAGRLELLSEEYLFDELIMTVEDIIAARLQEKDIRLEISIADDIPKKLFGDRGKIHQILINVLGNAVKFTERGKISLEVSFHYCEERQVRIEFRVTDTGIGIKQEDMGKLFNYFSQVDTMRNRRVEGTGIGLALSRRLASLMNGDITANSEYGVGSTFTVTVQQEVLEKYDISDKENAADYVAYIYEDDYDVRWYLTRLLSQAGVSSVFLNDVEQLNALKDKDYDMEKTMLFYSYEKNYQMVKEAQVPFRTIALMEYYTIAKPDCPITYYLRKPFDIFRVRKAVFNPEMSEMPLMQGTKVSFRDTRVAVVDDNKVNLKVTATLLREMQIIPEAFASGAAVLKALNMGREYDVIFMDHMMPEMDGVETARRIRSIGTDYTEKAVIIALTANAINGVEKEYLEAGMNDCLFKPVSSEQLKEKLLKYVSSEKIFYSMEEENDAEA